MKLSRIIPLLVLLIACVAASAKTVTVTVPMEGGGEVQISFPAESADAVIEQIRHQTTPAAPAAPDPAPVVVDEPAPEPIQPTVPVSPGLDVSADSPVAEVRLDSPPESLYDLLHAPTDQANAFPRRLTPDMVPAVGEAWFPDDHRRQKGPGRLVRTWDGELENVVAEPGYDIDTVPVPDDAIRLPDGADRDAIHDALNTGKSVLFKRGGTYIFNDAVYISRGGNVDKPVVVGAWGEGPAPKLVSTRGGVFQVLAGGRHKDPLNYFAMRGLDISYPARIPGRPEYDRSRDRESPVGIRWLRAGDWVSISDCRIEGFWQGVVVSGDDVNRRRGPRNLFVRRNAIVNNRGERDRACGLYVSQSRLGGVIVEDNVFWGNGWYPDRPETGATTQSHNVYLDDGYSRSFDGSGLNVAPAVVRGNYFGSPGAWGVKQHSGGINEGNIYDQCPQPAFTQGNDTVFRGNLIVNPRNYLDAPVGFLGDGWKFLHRSGGLEAHRETESKTNPKVMQSALFEGNLFVRGTGAKARTPFAIKTGANRSVIAGNKAVGWSPGGPVWLADAGSQAEIGGNDVVDGGAADDTVTDADRQRLLSDGGWRAIAEIRDRIRGSHGLAGVGE